MSFTIEELEQKIIDKYGIEENQLIRFGDLYIYIIDKEIYILKNDDTLIC